VDSARTVRHVGLVIGSVDDAALLGLAERARELPFSYQHIGVTRELESDRVDGFRVDRDGIELGGDAALFEAANDALRRWAVHRGAGLRVAPTDAPIATGVSVVVAIKLPMVTAIAPCRVVWTVDEADRFGFAYGTLVGHPAAGEESFVIARTTKGIRFDISTVSRPAGLLARIGAPVAQQIQRRTTRRYLSSLANAVVTPVT
jgi:uncharacterized protein (UPF0548 family)